MDTAGPVRPEANERPALESGVLSPAYFEPDFSSWSFSYASSWESRFCAA